MIRQIPGVRGAQAYLYHSGVGLAVIDPGYTGSFRAVLRFVEELSLGKIDWVILTHHHIDHAGTALALCQATGARLAVHQADGPYLQPRRPKERMTLWGLVDRLPSGLARFVVTCAGGAARLLEDGETIAGLTVVHGPGHTPGSIALHSEPESALFLGDILNNERGIRTPPWNVNHSHRRALQAPHRLESLHFERAYFGHGPVIIEGADQRVRAFLLGRPVAPAVAG
jgi:glyoxylase-like metal-dependent hydrolase (beta-lactamase superfamily II)